MFELASTTRSIREFNDDRDHVHLLVHYAPKVAISKLVNNLKGASGRQLRLGHLPA